MTFLHSINPLYSLSGLLVGILVGLTGVGGGSLMTPLLILLFGIHPATAVGTDLLYASATKTVGTTVHGAAKTIAWRVVGRLALGSVPATAFTIYMLSLLGPASDETNRVITTVLGVALFLTAFSLIFRKRILAFYAARMGKLRQKYQIPFTILLGAALGVLVTISSVGAGALGVTVLIVLYPHMPLVRVVGSDIAHAVPLTLVAGLGHWWLGSVDLTLLFSLLIGSVPGIVIGSFAATRFPEPALRFILATILVIVAGRLFVF